MPLLRVEDLSVSFPSRNGRVYAVEGASFDIEAGKTVGLVGESGSGKTVTSLAILGLIQSQGGRVTGHAHFEGRDLVGMKEKELEDIRGARVGMIFQQALRSLDPAFTVGEQIAETVRRHRDVTRKEAWARAVEMLDLVFFTEEQLATMREGELTEAQERIVEISTKVKAAAGA